MSALVTLKTTCNRDCPDACGILADVEDGRVVALRGDPEHPVTRGFLCYRTSRFPKRQYSSERITKPLLRRGDRQVEIPLDEALDIAAERLGRIKAESGPAAILHYRSGGSLGMLKMLSDLFFEHFGPTSVKRGDICSGGGDAAQELDFGREDSNDLFDVLHAKHIMNWGKNLHVSNVHLVPIVKEAQAKGARLVTIDPVKTRTAEMSDLHVQLRPEGDIALALHVLQHLFARGLPTPEIAGTLDHLDALRALAFARTPESLSVEHDVPAADVARIAAMFADGPTAILVGWGLGRTRRGANAVRLLDALSAVSGNLGRRGGGVSFYYKRRGAFDSSFIQRTPPPRTFLEPRLGHEMLEARDPPLRAIWVTAGNPVAMLPDSKTVARAFERLELSIVVDAFHTDTTRRATLVFPTTTLLEDDDVMGAYGHHFVGVSRPVIAPPPDVLTDLQLLQAIAKRVGLEHVMAGTAREWKARFLARAAEHGVTVERLEAGAAKSPFAKDVLFDGLRFDTPSGRVNLVHELPEREPRDPAYPLQLLSNSTEKSQSSQWAIEPKGFLPATVHPDAAPGFADGDHAKLVSPLGALDVTIVLDASERRDVVIVPKGGSLDRGWAANTLVAARETDLGEGAAYLSTFVRLERAT